MSLHTNAQKKLAAMSLRTGEKKSLDAPHQGLEIEPFLSKFHSRVFELRPLPSPDSSWILAPTCFWQPCWREEEGRRRQRPPERFNCAQPLKNDLKHISNIIVNNKGKENRGLKSSNFVSVPGRLLGPVAVVHLLVEVSPFF